jgi:hypothetical protein
VPLSIAWYLAMYIQTSAFTLQSSKEKKWEKTKSLTWYEM